MALTKMELLRKAFDATGVAFRVQSKRVSSANASTKIAVGTSSASVLASNNSRVFFVVVNDSDTVIFLNLSATAVLNEGIRLNANGGIFNSEKYTGAVAAISSAASKNLTLTEL